MEVASSLDKSSGKIGLLLSLFAVYFLKGDLKKSSIKFELKVELIEKRKYEGRSYSNLD